jgi:Fe2+ transport system protein FeoA
MKSETLRNLPPGKVEITKFEDSVNKKLRMRLFSLGIFPSQIIEIMLTGSPMIIKVLDSRLALGEPLISQILVKEIEPNKRRRKRKRRRRRFRNLR